MIGGSIIDLVVSSADQSELKMDSSTNQGKIKMSFGGVGRNLADALARLESDPVFVSAVGDDHFGSLILGEIQT